MMVLPVNFTTRMYRMFLEANYCIASSTVLPPKTAKYVCINPLWSNSYLSLKILRLSHWEISNPHATVRVEHQIISSWSRTNLRVNLIKGTQNRRMKK